ncbi:lysophospholipid acyltransferase family protein [Microtetraspora sp. NBRC 16547]|uniref:lysophospholipid acyltransferase family protein n=1 Tax=Microtetraspora sp. NBRC 16547 TaxID=3030993 RepID=UPI0024A1B12C|nr:lysophospholipid acyltransferase family protein [Microtetraspora sp. NBRC 16547]GLW96803.1 1-acyl-sn-glycerol-3-phosphate acyltransferase [Microtetraspora sp. NBRC 16547]
MAEIVYPPVIRTALALFKALDLKIRVEGAERIPRKGGAVLVSNHVSYLDFVFAGLAARPSRRLVRFMAKKEVFDNPVAGPLMRGMHHIPVDRSAGAGAFGAAVRALKDGEIVGNFAEATISRSFTVKDIKSGPIRMASDAGVPLIPVAVWGPHRLWTKGRPRKLLQRHVPVTILVGEPMHPEPGTPLADTTAELRRRMSELLDRAQRTYPDIPPGVWWQPTHLGGTAPTPEEAAALDRPRGARRAEPRPGEAS